MTAEQQLQEDLRRRAQSAAEDRWPGAVVTDVAPLTGGASSLTFLATVVGPGAGEVPVVLKVAPPGLPPVRNRDVLRQGKLMRALHGRPGVVVPEVLFEDAGAPPEVPPFVAMAFVPGQCVEPVLDERGTLPEGEVRARAFDAVRVLAALHSLLPAQIGLGDEPVVSAQAEIDRWTRAFETVPEELQGEYLRCARRLSETIPPALPPVVTHGDYRLGNTLCEDGQVRSVIDWEIWSLGDPRIDVTWLVFFTDEARHPASPSDEPTGMPTAQELIDAYTEARGAPLPDLDWFTALTKYKEAAATALLIKRGLRAGALSDSLTRMRPALPQLLDEALSLVG
ncbi:MAG: phosphotransferase family protein [Aeromicrobium sp.]